MLPRVMWRKSALGLGMLVNFSSSRLGVANQELNPSKIPPFLDPEITPTKIPILSLEKEPTFEIETENRQRLFKWTEMLLGKRESLVSGYLLPPELKIEDCPILEQEQKAINNQDAEQRIARFRRMTSPMGRKLASLLAAAPVIRLPIVRLIQECMLPQSDRTQIAEVFLGGLLKPKAEFELDINIDPETVEYEFIDPEIRDIFVSEAPISDSVDIINAVSRYIAEQMGVSLSNFMAMLKGRQKADNKQQENTIKHFAEVTARVLRKLGSQYQELAHELESAFASDPEPTPRTETADLYALLIGIDFYFPNRLSDSSYYINLDGAVRNIENVEKFLLRQPKQPKQIFKLTATSPNRASLLDPPKPIEPEEQLPTYANIIKHFDEITKVAKKGDLVYIHYSGHGGRAKSIYPREIKSNGIDETLVPTDIGTGEGQYI